MFSRSEGKNTLKRLRTANTVVFVPWFRHLTKVRNPSMAQNTSAPAVELDRRRILLIMVGLFLGMMLAALDQTIVATALPTIAGDLHDLSHLSWIVTAYILTSTISTPLWGKIGDLYGRKTFFQVAIIIFLIGSILSGLSQSMLDLILFRALQGIGGGGLMVGAQTIIADVVSARDRGRYQGIFGAVFGVTSVIGPLIGGFLVQHLSWHWIFYVNVPLGIIALIVTAAVLPGTLSRVSHIIDYAGTLLLAGVATGLVLLTTLAGTTYAWSSVQIIGLAVISVVLLIGFILVERRAAEPVLSLALFRNSIFTATSIIGFVVGFAMFGAITYLPQYMQVVRGASPTASGLELLPMMAGLLLTSITSGILISRWGRYKIFPILGTGLMAIGMFLLSLMTVGTTVFQSGIYMFVLGVGLGGVMQVLVIAVQNAVNYDQLGVATAGATFFRSIGGSFGTAVFGALFAAQFTRNIARDLAGIKLPAHFSAAAGASPAALAKLPPLVHSHYIHAYATSLHFVFLVAVPISALAFLFSWFLKEIPLRKTVQATNLADTLAPTSMPSIRTSIEELARSLSVLARHENQRYVYQRLLERAGLTLDVRHGWALLRLADHPGITIEQSAHTLKVPLTEWRKAVDQLAEGGYVEKSQGPVGTTVVSLTETGKDAVNRLATAREDGLAQLMVGWDPEQHAEIRALMSNLARDVITHESGRQLFLAQD